MKIICTFTTPGIVYDTLHDLYEFDWLVPDSPEAEEIEQFIRQYTGYNDTVTLEFDATHREVTVLKQVAKGETT